MKKKTVKPQGKPDMVNHPPHYNAYPIEVKDIIKMVLNSIEGLTPYEQYCLGNEIKYRLRAGLKDQAKIEEDIKKSIFYMNERKAD